MSTGKSVETGVSVNEDSEEMDDRVIINEDEANVDKMGAKELQ